ncbi:baseplate J/gp47 family protein [Spongiactinospora sp. TRM90649]|uniref:baseplate J/gp47 family protein n=1 Tax=Spongiactinospora sp. TRM90649 TaxID=3031114 RepID=UPI0023F663F6|nr:baseplate J/gp47 family protein [Spongiactinospora sp. TRM90649]MDF5753129.1 baseplate J/gp47 family protein [Spongiactinospora sp. TRM90649]
MRYVCRNQRRLPAVKEAGVLNGIEYLEVATAGPVQRTLLARLLKPAAGVAVDQVSIDGGERIPVVGVQWVAPADALPAGEDPALVAGLADLDHVLVVRTDQAGDFSYYTLRIDSSAFDPLLREVDFSFKVACDTGFDCRDEHACVPRTAAVPDLDYLAKDYASLRRMLLDRVSLISPRWRERTPADLGVTLLEMLAYAGDRLSYRQDAIATESYLDTARSRISLRRHARLVDYRIHDGSASRVLLRCEVTGNGVEVPAGTRVYSRVEGLPGLLTPERQNVALAAGATVFETTDRAVLYQSHAVLCFYTWGDDECCLPAGATEATLRGNHPNLRAGDILIFAEVLGPATGDPADADPRHLWPVRLTHVVPAQDPSGGRFLNPPTAGAVAVTRIAWDAADRPPFPVCVSAPAAGGRPVSVAWGNVIVADHGRTMPDEPLGTVPQPHLSYAGVTPPRAVPARYRPRLRFGPLTRAVEVNPPVLATTERDAGVMADLAARNPSSRVRDWLAGHGVEFRHAPLVVRGAHDEWSVSDGETVVRIRAGSADEVTVLARPIPAAHVTAATPRRASPRIELTDGTNTWHPRWDLLASDAAAAEFAVESEHDGSTCLRLNRPVPGTAFTARYRTGNGVSGNVGANTLVHMASTAGVVTVTNPMPAAGGHEPETGDEIRRDAPAAYLVQERAVTPADWEEVATRHPDVQRATATWRWTGSWHTVFLTVDRVGGADVDDVFERELRAGLERYRLAGYDLEINGPRYVPLEIGLHVCVAEGHLRTAVRREVLNALTGLFHPDRLTFAQPVYLSPVYATAQAVPGVSSVHAYLFRRLHSPGGGGLAAGVLRMGRLEIARLDNNPNFPERGKLTLTIGGGR